MASFDSPITKKKFTAQPFRDLEVPDESGYTPPPQPPEPQMAPGVNQRYNPLQEAQQFQERMQTQVDPNLAQIEQEVRQARQQRLQGQNYLNEGAKKRIEMLIGMTRVTRQADIEGNSYTLQTLKAKEMREAILAASEYDNTVQFPFEVRKQFVARSLREVAGVPIEQFVGANTLEARLAFIDELDDILLNRLMDEYSALVNETKNKYAIRTTEQVQEVADDLKKSV